MGHPDLSLIMMHSQQPGLHRELYALLGLGVRASRSPFTDLAHSQSREDAIQLVRHSLDLIKQIGDVERFTLGHFLPSMWHVDE